MTAAELTAALKRGEIGGPYLFCGAEDYLRTRYTEMLRNAVLAPGDTLNRIVLDGESLAPDALCDALSDAAEAFPVMADRKLIEVRGIALDGMAEGIRETLHSLLASLVGDELNVVVLDLSVTEFDPGDERHPAKLFSEWKDAVTPVVFPRQTDPKLAKWLAQHFRASGVAASPEVCGALMDVAGHDMYTLAAESDKLSAFVLSQGRTELTAEDIALAAVETKEIDPFDLTDAILSGDGDRAMYILSEKQLRKEPPERVLADISGVVRGMLTCALLRDEGDPPAVIAKKTGIHEYRVGLLLSGKSGRDPERLRRALTLCYAADKKLKTTSLPPYVLLERLALELAVGAEEPEETDAV